MTGEILGVLVVSQLSVACPVAYTIIRAEPGEPSSKLHTLTTRVPEADQSWLYS